MIFSDKGAIYEFRVVAQNQEVDFEGELSSVTVTTPDGSKCYCAPVSRHSNSHAAARSLMRLTEIHAHCRHMLSAIDIV